MRHTTGAIVLAAYQPDPELFARQVASLRDQTVRDWTCIVVVDGEPDAVAETLHEVVGDDDRFRLLADGARLGFYLNFERGLLAVPPDAAWIALADQDDYWYPGKLEQLLPFLETFSLVSGQARLVEHPGGHVVGRTDRRGLGALATVLNNQYTGSLSVLRADLLRTALPFPRTSTRAVAHDHWLAVVAEAADGAHVVDEVVQDYTQHGGNVFGDPSQGAGGLRTRLINARRFADQYEGSHSPAALARMVFWAFVGWRQLMVDTLGRRLPSNRTPELLSRAFGARRTLCRVLPLLLRARSKGYVPSAFVASYLISWGAGVLVSGRRRARPTT